MKKNISAFSVALLLGAIAFCSQAWAELTLQELQSFSAQASESQGSGFFGKSLTTKCATGLVSGKTVKGQTSNGNQFEIQFDESSRPQMVSINGQVTNVEYEVENRLQVKQVTNQAGEVLFAAKPPSTRNADYHRLKSFLDRVLSGCGMKAVPKAVSPDGVTLDDLTDPDFYDAYIGGDLDDEIVGFFDWGNPAPPKCDTAKPACRKVCDDGFDLALIGVCGPVAVVGAAASAGVGAAAGVACGVGAYLAREHCRVICESIPCSP